MAENTVTIDPTDDAHKTTVTTRPGWVHVAALGLEVVVYPDHDTGSPVVQVDTPDMAETAAGPIMRLSLNDHDYLDNADGKGESMRPGAGLARAISTVMGQLNMHEEGRFLELLTEAGVLQLCNACQSATLGPDDTACPHCGTDRDTALDPDTEPDEEETTAGCSCGMADYGAPGHEGHADFDADAAQAEADRLRGN